DVTGRFLRSADVRCRNSDERVRSLYGRWMRRSLVLLALIAIPLTACGSGATTSEPPATSDSAVMSSRDATMTQAMTEAMTSGSASADSATGSAGSMMDQPESPVTEDSMHPSDAMTAESSPAQTTPGVTI